MTFGTVIALIKAGLSDSGSIAEAVDAWLEAHPEATTTVQDGSITKDKLVAALSSEITQNTEDVGDLKSALDGVDVTVNGLVVDNFTDGKALTRNYTIVDDPNISISDEIPITWDWDVNDRLQFFYNDENAAAATYMMWLLDQNKDPVEWYGSIADRQSRVINMPANAAYFRFSFKKGTVGKLDNYNGVVYYTSSSVLQQNGVVQKIDNLNVLVNGLEDSQADTDSYIDDIKVFEQNGNIFNAKTDFIEGQYYYRSGSTLSTGSNANYNGFIIPVAQNSRYTFVTSNIVLLDAEKKPIQTGGSWDYEAVTSCNSENAAYFAVTYRLSYVPADGYAISKGGALDYGAYSSGYYAKAYTAEKSTVKRVNGAVASGGSLSVLGKTAVKDGQEVVFKGKFSSFNKITIAFSASGSTNVVSVDTTNLIVVNTSNNTITEAHGLSIANDITILLEIKKGQMFVSITSMGVTFKYDCFWNQTGGVPSECVATASGMAFSNAELSVNYSAAKRSIWYFGDSYAQFGTDTRIPYYMVEYGFDENVLFNAVSGGSSAGANQSFNTLLSYGTPTLAVIATGMNDGSDADANTPNASWLTQEQNFIETCEMNGVIPILCTVPSVPGISHEGKNAWVRASGKRYIDFAGAVGATPAGEWYAGMLSSDNVHPSTLGGNALFTQLIADLPEVMG